jgi:hypothetical protein
MSALQSLQAQKHPSALSSWRVFLSLTTPTLPRAGLSGKRNDVESMRPEAHCQAAKRQGIVVGAAAAWIPCLRYGFATLMRGKSLTCRRVPPLSRAVYDRVTDPKKVIGSPSASQRLAAHRQGRALVPARQVHWQTRICPNLITSIAISVPLSRTIQKGSVSPS